MDSPHAQEAHLRKAGHIIHARAGAVDGLQVRGRQMGRQRGAQARAECNPDAHPPVPAAPCLRRGEASGEPEALRRDQKRNRLQPATGDLFLVGNDQFGRSECEIRFKSLLLRLRGLDISRTLAVKIVGGEKRLDRLVNQGKLHVRKRNGAANTMWRFDAAEVVQYVKPSKLFLL